MWYKTFIRPFLFSFDPERIHHLSFRALKFLYRLPGGRRLMRRFFVLEDQRLEKEVFGLKFKNPVGLAAGFDKDAQLVDELAALGFGFIEIGTLTPQPQPGNEKPRLFRLPDDRALVNRMGFNNEGAITAVQRLKTRHSKVIVGGNIGKNKVTENKLAYQDYDYCLEALYEVVDYFVVNVSSPNTPNLRDLQDKGPLTELLNRLKKRMEDKAKRKPILLKIAPDLTEEQLDDIVEIVFKTKIDGVIATNTTVSREGLKSSDELVANIGAGGLSGQPLSQSATEVIRYLYQRLGDDYPIIGVGGIMTPEDALEKLQAGASLIQVYTGFVYNGPGFVRQINQAILKQ